MRTQKILQKLKVLADPEKVIFKEKKFGITAKNSLGIYQKDINLLAKAIGKDSALAQELFDTGVYEARLLCSKIFKPKELTEELMEKWVATFDNWEICDSFCMIVFAKSKFALDKINDWTSRSPEFEKRAGFVIMAAYCTADKKADNETFEAFPPVIQREVDDDRLYVKKAVNWALRSMGKRNTDLHQQAIEIALEILKNNKSKSAQWIAKDALRELEKEGLRISDYPRHIYRPKKIEY